MAPPQVADALDPDRVGPHPSYIEIARPYVFQHTITASLAAAGVSEAKDESIRLQGVAWIDSVRKYMQLPVKTYDTACVYYHKFRLVHPDSNGYIDAAASALFTACKIEDTLKKSKEILCAAYNMKVSPAEQLTPDDPLFENHSKTIIGLERLMLEASGFDFRNRYPQEILIKFAKRYNADKVTVGKTAYNISLDMYRTFAPLKQTTTTMALACVELAGRIHEKNVREIETGKEYEWFTSSREEVMETLLDLLDLYTHHRAATIVGQSHALEAFIAIRIALNQEASANSYPRFTRATVPKVAELLNGFKATNGTTGSKAKEVTPTTSPRNDLMQDITSPTTGASKPGLKEGTVRFMLDPQRAKAEKETVAEYFKVEKEEYEVEVERERRRP
ncbi:hypothetical protein ABVK25_003360 [Lepraria finkii]|uniref:Cyclin-H n=1 Tax=Lepraria finkii TaxID=1340010 RepID=A0ABR4BEQ7_9LECA